MSFIANKYIHIFSVVIEQFNKYLHWPKVSIIDYIQHTLLPDRSAGGLFGALSSHQPQGDPLGELRVLQRGLQDGRHQDTVRPAGGQVSGL